MNENIVFENENARLLCLEIQKLLPGQPIDFEKYVHAEELTEHEALNLYKYYEHNIGRKLM